MMLVFRGCFHIYLAMASRCKMVFQENGLPGKKEGRNGRIDRSPLLRETIAWLLDILARYYHFSSSLNAAYRVSFSRKSHITPTRLPPRNGLI